MRHRLDVGQDLAGLEEHGAPWREETHPAARPLEELHAELLFEGAYLPGERRLGDVESLGGAAHVLLFRDHDEVAKLRQAHAAESTRSAPQARIPKRYWTLPSHAGHCAPMQERIELVGSRDLPALRRAGRAAAELLALIGTRLAPGVRTREIDQWVRAETERQGGRPSQLGYHGFPAAVCVSRNEVVCHGIPGETELRAGDIVNTDVTTELDGFHGDTSATFFIGEPDDAARRLVETARRCRDAGIAVVRAGARLGDIGAAVQEVAHAAGYSVVRDFGGHGIGRRMHQAPHVSHVGVRGTGARLRAGMAITIEPMINEGKADVRVTGDRWTVVTCDGSRSAQFEHTVLVTEGGCEILTAL